MKKYITCIRAAISCMLVVTGGLNAFGEGPTSGTHSEGGALYPFNYSNRDVSCTGPSGSNSEIRIVDSFSDTPYWINSAPGGGTYTTYTNYFVRDISENAFRDSKDIMQVSFDTPNYLYIINKSAFEGCVNLVSLDFTKATALNSIEERAFADCAKLEAVSLPDGVCQLNNSLFAGCTSLKDVSYSLFATTIGEGVFENCTSLQTFEIRSNINSIGENAFKGCDALLDVYCFGAVPPTLSDLSLATANRVLHVPAGYKEVYMNVAEWNKFGQIIDDIELENPNISYTIDYENVTAELSLAASEIINVVIPEKITKKGIEYPVVKIDAEAFKNCSQLESISLPTTIKTIGMDAFSGCTSLKKVEIDDLNAWFNIDFATGKYTYSNPLQYAKNLFLNGEQIIDLKIPDGIKEIKPNSLWGFNGESVTIPSTVESIGMYAFNECTSLKKVEINDLEAWFNIDFATDGSFRDSYTYSNPLQYAKNLFMHGEQIVDLKIPEGLQEIKPNSLWGFKGESVTIPSTVESIGNYAFNETGLKRIVFENTDTPLVLGCSGGNYNSAYMMVEDYYNLFSSCSVEEIHYGRQLSGGHGVAPFSSTRTPLKKVEISRYVKDLYLPALADDAVISVFNELPPGINSITNSTNAVLHIVNGSQDSYKAMVGWNNFGSYIDDLVIPDFGPVFYSVNPQDRTAKIVGSTSHINLDVPEEILTEDGRFKVTALGVGAFAGDAALRSIKLPKTITEIDDNAFYHCSSLTTFEMPQMIERIGNHAFDGCWRLKEVDNLYKLRSLGNASFYNCSSLASIDIPGSVDIIGDEAFSGCTMLGAAKIADGVGLIGEYAFANCTNLRRIDIPRSVADIGISAFSGCRTLEALTISDGVRSVGAGAFKNCVKLSDLDLGSTIDYIGEAAFWNCGALTRLELPQSLTSIGGSAFYGCTMLNKVRSNAIVPPACNANFDTFVNHSLIELSVPIGSVNLYQSAVEWSKFSNIVEENETTGVADINVIDNEPIEVYNVNGLRLNVSRSDELSNLPAGLYIVNGQKVVIR